MSLSVSIICIIVILMVQPSHISAKPPGSKEKDLPKENVDAHKNVVDKKTFKQVPAKQKPAKTKQEEAPKDEGKKVVKVDHTDQNIHEEGVHKPREHANEEKKDETKHVNKEKEHGTEHEEKETEEERHQEIHKPLLHDRSSDQKLPGDVKSKSGKYVLSKDESCAQDVVKYCNKVKKDNNFAVFICLQEAIQREEDMSEECEQTMWHYKYNLTSDPRFDEAAIRVCGEAIDDIKECHTSNALGKDGFFMSCLVEHRHEVKDPKCSTFLTKMAAVIFSDYRLINGFYADCQEDVKKLKCGQLVTNYDDNSQHEQEDVISCLDSQLKQVGAKCQKQLLRVAELQADDYHLDRPLYYACQDARERFCHDVKAGEGRIYKCLMTHINDEMIGEECGAKLHDRQALMQENKKVNFALWTSCKADFEKYNCEEKGLSEHGEASNLLLCLQEKVAEGKPVSPNCRGEMREVAVQIFDNYKISPVIVANCDTEIQKECKQFIGSTDNGLMMDCLMTIAATNDSLSKQCFEAVTTVLKETGAGNNYKVDRALYLACEPAISSLCDGKDDTMMMGCLMDNVHNPKMPESCSTQVFHLQYFLSRDFRLDASLYHDCKSDAEQICHASDFTEKSESKQPHNFVIACLYRNSVLKNKEEKQQQVSTTCSGHIRRVMHQRATNIRLMPEIESPCLTDLGKYCIDKANAEGEELQCLQDNYEQLSELCKTAIGEYTELEARDFDLDKHLVDKCGPMVTKFCKRELEDGGGEQVLPCLISHKNDMEMDTLCEDALEHWQIMEMKDFRFSPALKDECLEDIRVNCHESKSKTDAIKCLSQAIVTDFKKISATCRHQLKKELMEQSENIKLMPELFKACAEDIKKLCSHVPPSGAQMEECLKKNHKKLTNRKCIDLLFEQEKAESEDPDLDYRLMHVCKPMIKKYCMSYTNAKEIVECLRQSTHDRDMSVECRGIIKERQIEQAESFILDADLSSYCKADAVRYCKKQIEKSNSQGALDNAGEVFGCLVEALMEKKKISSDCENFIRRREAEAAVELDLNPQLFLQCNAEMRKVCPNVLPDDMIDCLKQNIPKIKTKGCVEEVRKLIVEGIEDVHVDPHLEEKCSRDIRTFCQDMPKKSGNVVLCLIDVHKAKNLHLQSECDNFLTKRLSLYNTAHVELAAFDSITSVLEAVSSSPNRNSIYIIVMLVLGVLFLGGIIFGRVTKRAHADMKNR